MKEHRKSAREWLMLSTRKPFNEVIDEAKLTPTQLSIAVMKFIKGKRNYEIAVELNISESTVDKEVAKAYDAICRVLRSI